MLIVFAKPDEDGGVVETGKVEVTGGNCGVGFHAIRANGERVHFAFDFEQVQQLRDAIAEHEKGKWFKNR